MQATGNPAAPMNASRTLSRLAGSEKSAGAVLARRYNH